MRANKTYTHRHQVKRFALLRRVLHCGECGSLVQPSWSKRHGREYHYYVCSKRVRTGYSKCFLPALPSGEIEGLVVEQFRLILRHPDVIARTYQEIVGIESQDPSQPTIELSTVTDALRRMDPLWEVLHPHEQRRILELLVDKVTVRKDSVDVQFRCNGIEHIIEELQPERETYDA